VPWIISRKFADYTNQAGKDSLNGVIVEICG
jgi:hypothetical protein